ncbi:MAG: DUF2752 domain-containing protein [Bacteroidetes bacterium]|nr:DUF2752 domain-containing protein [bacterium]NBP64172.1 DUF2752 domain-containing protein [Bacteroidota bacterium]
MTSAQRLSIAVFILWASGLSIGYILLNYPPSQYAYIPCMFHLTTGLHCPGCGSTRAIASLLRGDIAMALKNNLLIVLWGPYLAYRGMQQLRSWIDGKPKTIWEPPKQSIILFLIVTIMYTVLRNVPIEAIHELLAPSVH